MMKNHKALRGPTVTRLVKCVLTALVALAINACSGASFSLEPVSSQDVEFGVARSHGPRDDGAAIGIVFSSASDDSGSGRGDGDRMRPRDLSETRP